MTRPKKVVVSPAAGCSAEILPPLRVVGGLVQSDPGVRVNCTGAAVSAAETG